MNKKIIIIISSIFIIIGGYLLGSVGLKFFFNDYLYETPNLRGLTVEKAEMLIDDNFKLVNMGEDYSEFKRGEIYSQLPVSPKQIKYGRPIKIWVSKGTDTVLVPHLNGISVQDARVLLNDLGVKIKNVSHVTDGTLNNIVVGTDPKGGTPITRGSSISLLINVSKAKNVRMPDILGYSVNEVGKILRKRKLVVGSITKTYNTEFPEGTIIDVNIPAGKNVLVGSVIDIIVTTEEEEE